MMSREQSLIPKILKAFSSENALPPHYVLSYEIDFCFSEHKLEIRADEKGHTDRYINYEIKTQKQQKKNLDINLLELILMQKIIIVLLKLVEYAITFSNQPKNQLKNQPKSKLLLDEL